MSRFLLVVPPLVGHINPAVGTAAELTERGHEVAWAGHSELIRQFASVDATVFGCALDRAGLDARGIRGGLAERECGTTDAEKSEWESGEENKSHRRFIPHER